MHIFIDESGAFTGYHTASISVVGALAIPSGKLKVIEQKYARIRHHLPTEKGEVKGRLLNEQQVDKVITLLARNEVVFEIVAIDLGLQNEGEVVGRRQKHAEEMLSRVERFREPDRQLVEDVSRRILTISLPLYVQAMLMLETLRNVINHIPLYFVQRRPEDLRNFTWIIDGKDPKKVTNWEMWWSLYAIGALSTMSRYQPQPMLEGANYSFYECFDGCTREPSGEVVSGTDLKLLLQDLRFSSLPDPGLELVDIATNAVRRALTGTLRKEGWGRIPRLMIHRKEPYIKFILLKEGADRFHSPPYLPIVKEGFSYGGKSMLSPRFLALAASES